MEREYLGDFKVIRKIGAGPLGALYLGEHKFIKRRFVIKVLPPEISADFVFIERFEREIGKVATLEHMNLVKVHNVSSVDGIYFIVSDFIADVHGESRNLSQYLGGLEKRLSETEVMQILKQIAYALDYIHGKKFDGQTMVHSSLKLNNILIGKTEEGIPHVYLSDIGLNSIIGQGKILTKAYQTVAETLEIDLRISGLDGDRIYASQNPEKGKITKLHRSFLQTYAFLAPEQKLGGNPERIGPKADTYAFGVLAYFLLMGYLPEGYFNMPSQSKGEFSFNWDLLIQATLRSDPEQRPDSLVALMGEIAAKELGYVEKTIVKVSPPKESFYGKRIEPEVREEKKEPIKQASLVEKVSYAKSPIEESLTPPVSTATRLMTNKKNSQAEQESDLDGGVATLVEKKPVIRESELLKQTFEEDPGAIFQRDLQVAPYRPQVKEISNIEPILTSMVMIIEGEYMRGSNIGARDEKPRHKVQVKSFAIDIHPVTNEQFIRFLQVMGGEKDSNNNDIILLKESRINRVGGKLSIETGYTKHPVVGVSWYGAVAYAKWTGKRLPTEVEWEIAATSGKEINIYPCGAEIERTRANFFSSDTTPVMSYPANEMGLYDVAGNVYEWCEDWYAYNYYEVSMHEPINPTGPHQGVYRVLRGGCWKSLAEDLRCSHRHRNNPGMMNRTCGFRLAADVADE
jgi:formylglycine-generating enzyme required for sulfatase activity